MKFAAEKMEKPIQAVAAAVRAATTVTSAEIDTAGWDEMVVLIDKGVTDGTLDVSFTQSGTSGGTFVASPAAYDFAQIAAGAAGVSAMQIDLRNAIDLDRFLKVEATTGGGTGNNYGILVLLRNPNRSELQDVAYAKRPA